MFKDKFKYWVLVSISNLLRFGKVPSPSVILLCHQCYYLLFIIVWHAEIRILLPLNWIKIDSARTYWAHEPSGNLSRSWWGSWNRKRLVGSTWDGWAPWCVSEMAARVPLDPHRCENRRIRAHTCFCSSFPHPQCSRRTLPLPLGLGQKQPGPTCPRPIL